MTPKKTRQPAQQVGSIVKTPDAPRLSTNDQHPLLCLEHNANEYGVVECETDEQAAFAQWIHRISQFTWGELALKKYDHYGYKQIDSDAIRILPPASAAARLDKYMVFRFQNGDGRVIGYRRDRVFHVLWVDAKLRLYKH